MVRSWRFSIFIIKREIFKGRELMVLSTSISILRNSSSDGQRFGIILYRTVLIERTSRSQLPPICAGAGGIKLHFILAVVNVSIKSKFIDTLIRLFRIPFRALKVGAVVVIELDWTTPSGDEILKSKYTRIGRQ